MNNSMKRRERVLQISTHRPNRKPADVVDDAPAEVDDPPFVMLAAPAFPEPGAIQALFAEAQRKRG